MLGAALLALFLTLNVNTGFVTIVIAHVMFTVSYVVVTVKARLEGMDRHIEEAAMDLGATEWTTFRKITLPMIAPGVAAAGAAGRRDLDRRLRDHVFNAGQTQTFPLFIFGATRQGVPPEVNVLATGAAGRRAGPDGAQRRACRRRAGGATPRVAAAATAAAGERLMRAVEIPRYGAPEVLRVIERPDPVAGPGQVLIDVAAAGVNFADTMARIGLYADAPKPPMVVGYEVAGTIAAVGDGVDASRVGERVMAGTQFGGYASRGRRPGRRRDPAARSGSASSRAPRSPSTTRPRGPACSATARCRRASRC